MAVMARERWTDEQLDKSFDRIGADLREVRVEMRRGFDRLEKRLDQFDKRFERAEDKSDAMQSEMNTRFDAVQQNMTTWFVALFSTILASAVVAVISLT